MDLVHTVCYSRSKYWLHIDSDSTFGPYLAVVYRTQNIIKDVAVAIKLEPIVHSSSVQREYNILKHLEGSVGIPCDIWFGRESMYHALVLDLLGPSLHNLFLAHNQKFSLDMVVNIEDQLVSQCVGHHICILLILLPAFTS